MSLHASLPSFAFFPFQVWTYRAALAHWRVCMSVAGKDGTAFLCRYVIA